MNDVAGVEFCGKDLGACVDHAAGTISQMASRNRCSFFTTKLIE